MVITNSAGNMNTTTVVSPKTLKNPKPPKSPRSPRKRSPRKHKKDSILYLPKDDEELFRHLYPQFVTDTNDDKEDTDITDIDDDEELVKRLFPWLLEN